MHENIYDMVYKLRKEFEKLDKAELWRFAVNAYYKFAETRHIMDFEVGRLAYLFYKRKGGKKEYRYYSLKFRKKRKGTPKGLFALRLKFRKRSEKRQAKRCRRRKQTSDLII